VGGGMAVGGVSGIGVEWATTDCNDTSLNYPEAFKQGLKGGFAGAIVATGVGLVTEGFQGSLIGTSLGDAGAAVWAGGSSAGSVIWGGVRAGAGHLIEAFRVFALIDSQIPLWLRMGHWGTLTLGPLAVYGSLEHARRRR